MVHKVIVLCWFFGFLPKDQLKLGIVRFYFEIFALQTQGQLSRTMTSEMPPGSLETLSKFDAKFVLQCSFFLFLFFRSPGQTLPSAILRHPLETST